MMERQKGKILQTVTPNISELDFFSGSTIILIARVTADTLLSIGFLFFSLLAYVHARLLVPVCVSRKFMRCPEMY